VIKKSDIRKKEKFLLESSKKVILEKVILEAAIHPPPVKEGVFLLRTNEQL